MKKKKCS